MCNYHPKLIILMVEQTPRAMVALLIVASVYFLAFFKFIPLNYLLIWFSCLALLAAFRLYNAKTLKKYIESKNEVKTRQHLMYFNISNTQACDFSF